MHLWKIISKISIALILIAILIVSCTEDCICPDDGTVNYYGWTVGGVGVSYGTVLHTKDGGQNWINQSDSILFAGVNFSDICILDKNNLLVVGSLQQDGTYSVFKSIDGGDSWFVSGTRALDNVDYQGLYALDENNIWIVGEQGSIFYSTDMADTWTKIEVPVEYQQDYFFRIAAKSPDDIWVVGDKHANDDYPIMLHTTNGGQDWERLNPIEDLNVNTADSPGHLLGVKVFGNSVWAIGGFGKFVIRSGDNGLTWEDITVPGTGGFYDANDIFLLSETEAYVVEDYGAIFSTNDAGLNWTQYYPYTGNWLLGIAILDNTNIWICGGGSSGNDHANIRYSPDAGTTWQDQTPQFLVDNPGVGLYKIRFIEVN